MATVIYHLALARDWQAAVRRDACYFPPTYEADGFTHATADPLRLLDVANHFYRGTTGDWLCLGMTEESLAEAGIEVKYEPAAPVGDKAGTFEGAESVLFPHIFGGIPPQSVIAVHAVTRDEEGRFVGIDSVAENRQHRGSESR